MKESNYSEKSVTISIAVLELIGVFSLFSLRVGEITDPPLQESMSDPSTLLDALADNTDETTLITDIPEENDVTDTWIDFVDTMFYWICIPGVEISGNCCLKKCVDLGMPMIARFQFQLKQRSYYSTLLSMHTPHLMLMSN